MTTQRLFIFILITALMLSACSEEDLADLERVGSPQPLTGGGSQANQSGLTGETGAKGQINTLIGEGGSIVNSQGTPANGDSGNISPGGEASGAAPGSDQAGELPSSSAGSTSGEDSLNKPIEWLSYVDNAFKFSIHYPDSYIILPEIEPQTDTTNLKPIHQVRFQDRQLATSDTAALQPAQFTVEVYTSSGLTSLKAFVQSNLPFPNMTVAPYTYGKLTGLSASTNRAMAPNEFYFFTGNGMIYKLTPLGPYSTEMLQSFAILP